MNQIINRELLFLYWSGLATPMQQKLIVRWLEDPSHQETFYQWLIEWEELHPQALGDSEDAWTSLTQQLEKQGETTPAYHIYKQTPRTWLGIFRWWTVAASLVLIGGLSFLLRERLFYTTHQTGNGEIISLQLPDGSRATLNANSELRVPALFLPYCDRTVKLAGEADFSVTHRSNKQRFVVETSSEVNVVVLGTEFVVRSRKDRFRVALHTGKIALEQRTRQGDKPVVTLRPGDVAYTDSGKDRQLQLMSHQPTRELAAWQEHLFVFDHHSLSEVLLMLKEQFGESIKLENASLATYQITGRFRAERAEDLLEIITELTGYRIETRNNQKYLVK
ncbi:FecR family protein [Persicitalea jodogahamensis]|uniref:Anti-sigma factor n=1 Tax=Persicitalea jodogahamensis TaxID=402147 RepID=A0A8J3D4X0_9BACT|nr:FecR domain-containing protein [Persicitalea jodogahamensis]GHB52564.1 anti-sigma factor [Persicitalea jodogahamensis]